MTIPGGGYPPFAPQTVQEAYDALRWHCNNLEHLLEANAHGLDEKALKRSDKAVTVMKVGFKILKKAIREPVTKPRDAYDLPYIVPASASHGPR